MALSDKDRAYIEHLIQRDERLAREQEQNYLSHLFEADRYFWDLHLWICSDRSPSAPGSPTILENETVVMECPDCLNRQELGVKSWSGFYPRHAVGCPFFKAEQRQWFDDHADILAGETIQRDLIWTEKALLRLFTDTKPEWLIMRVESDGDGQLLRRVVYR